VDFSYDDPEDARRLADRVRDFVDEVVLPEERGLSGGGSVPRTLIQDLRQEAKNRGLYAPQMPEEYGGLGLSFREVLPSFEEAGRSLLAPSALRVDAPDEGNMHTLEMVGSEEQKERWLRPLVQGEITSAFSMTEPQPGGGSDPKMIKTTAEREGDEWVINGHKWWTTQGSESDVLIVMARTDPDSHPYEGCSMILVPTDTPGVTLKRDIPHMGGETGVGHAEILYEDVRVPAENLLGEENAGFAIAQMRLGPARLTHCMRFSGMAERAVEVAKAYMQEREAFGTRLSDKQALRFELAESVTRLHAARTMVRHAARQITRGDQARTEVAMCKVFTANVVQDIIDTALQVCGGNGIGKDLPLATFYEGVRSFRIVDGADEVHKRSIARELFRDVHPEELDPLSRFEVSTPLYDPAD